MEEEIEETKRKTEFNKSIKSILENKALYEKVNKTKKAVGITADFDNNDLYRKHSNSIFLELNYGMIYYNSVSYHLNGEYLDSRFFASEIAEKKGEFVVGQHLPIKKSEELMDICKQTYPDYFTCKGKSYNNYKYIGKPLSNLFRYYDGKDILRILEKNLDRKHVESNLVSRISAGGIETIEDKNTKHLGFAMIELINDDETICFQTPLKKFSIPSYDYFSYNVYHKSMHMKCLAEALYTKRLYLTNVKIIRPAQENHETFCVSGDLYEENGGKI